MLVFSWENRQAKTCLGSAGKNRQAKKNMLGFRWEKQTS
jgi:hypothetical protein